MKKLSDNDVVFSSMSPKEALEFTGGYDKEKIKFIQEVKAKQRAVDAEKPREENVLERIGRINYEYGDSKKRPLHMDNKKIYSFEDRFRKDAKNINDRATPEQVGKLAERLEKSRQMTGYYDKKPKPAASVDINIDLNGITKSIDDYIGDRQYFDKQLNKPIRKEPKPAEGIAALLGEPEKY